MKDTVGKQAKKYTKELTKDMRKTLGKDYHPKWIEQVVYTAFLAGHNEGVKYAIKEMRRR